MTQFENYDLEKRTIDFSENLIIFLKKCPKTQLTVPLIDQCLRAGTSIGANYREANGASSKKDFFSKIYICKKESKETLHWLRMIAKSEPSRQAECRKFWQEAKELTLIFSSIAQKK